jgi:hypothetical protein
LYNLPLVCVFINWNSISNKVVQHLAQGHSEASSSTVATCKRLALQTISVTLQLPKARMIRFRRSRSPPLVAEELGPNVLRPAKKLDRVERAKTNNNA